MKYMYLFLFIAFCSCSKNKTYDDSVMFNAESFSEEVNLSGEIVQFDSIIMHPVDIIAHDSLLLTIDYGCEKLFSIFNMNTKKKIRECIMKGQGPNEMLKPRFVGIDDQKIQIFDMATSNIITYNTSEFIYAENPMPTNKVKLEKSVFINVGKTSDRMFGYSYDVNHQLYVFDSTGKKVDEIIEHPTTSYLSYSDAEKLDAFYMNFITNGVDKIALCYSMTDLIEIYKTNGLLEKRLHGPEHFFSYFKEYHDGDIISSSPVKGKNKDAYFSPENAGDVFFVLYNGGYIDDENHNSLCRYLYSISWEGIPQKKYILDNAIFSFAVDMKHKKIYGISNTPEYHIVEYAYN